MREVRDQLENDYGTQEGYDDGLDSCGSIGEKKTEAINIGYNLDEESNKTC